MTKAEYKLLQIENLLDMVFTTLKKKNWKTDNARMS